MHDDAIDEALRAGGGLIRSTGGLRFAVRRAVAAGRLRSVLPGVYCHSAAPDGVRIRAAAVQLLDPSAVILGRAAAALTWWPELPAEPVRAARRIGRPAPPGFHWCDVSLDPDHVTECHGLRVTVPSLTVLDLIPELGGRAVDEALRRRVVRLSELRHMLAATPARRDNRLRRAVLTDSRDEPWSEAERAFHRLLRAARLPWPYRTNLRVVHAGGTSYLDVAIPALRLAFEVDGWAFHGGAQAFRASHERDIHLGLCGWLVHHFAAASVFDRPDWVTDCVRRLCRDRSTSVGRSR